VDELGGYDTALKLAKRAAGVPADEEVRVVVYPRAKGFWESEFGWRTPENSEKEAVGQAMARILEEVQPVARTLDAAGIRARSEQDEVLRMRRVSSEP
jgi:ClpP class serine protease